MKKTILLALALLAGATSLSAASPVVNNPDNKPYLGVRVSAEASIPGNLSYSNVKTNNFDPGAGVSVGAVYNIPIVANFTVEPGLELYYNTTKFNTEDPILQAAQWKFVWHESARHAWLPLRFLEEFQPPRGHRSCAEGRVL